MTAIAILSSLLSTSGIEALKTDVGTTGAEEIFLTSPYVIPIFLSMIFAAAVLSSRTRIPHIMILVAFGIAISFFDFVGLNTVDIKQFRIDPRVVINFIIPPLIFEAMMKVNYKEFKTIRISAILLATVGVVLATLVTGSLLTYISHLPFAIAFTFAALIAPTDPAIVIEIFKRIRVPKQLSTLMEFEASFNDATALIVFSSVMTLIFASSAASAVGNTIVISSLSSSAITSPNDVSSISNASPIAPSSSSSSPTMNNLSFVSETEHFAIVFFGGAVIGLAIAAATHRLHALMNDPFSETAQTTLLLQYLAIIYSMIQGGECQMPATVGLEKRRYSGALVLKPEPKSYTTPIEIFDVKGLDPTVMILHNLSLQTICCDCCKDNPDARVPQSIMDSINSSLRSKIKSQAIYEKEKRKERY